MTEHRTSMTWIKNSIIWRYFFLFHPLSICYDIVSVLIVETGCLSARVTMCDTVAQTIHSATQIHKCIFLKLDFISTNTINILCAIKSKENNDTNHNIKSKWKTENFIRQNWRMASEMKCLGTSRFDSIKLADIVVICDLSKGICIIWYHAVIVYVINDNNWR